MRKHIEKFTPFGVLFIMRMSFVFFCVAFTLCGCADGVDAVKTAKEIKQDIEQIKRELALVKEATEQAQQEAQEAKQEVKKVKQEVHQATQEAREAKHLAKGLVREKDEAISKATYFIWALGAISLLIILYSPTRNLLMRGLFKMLPYKPRRFDRYKNGTK